jgi:hypothetical protein
MRRCQLQPLRLADRKSHFSMLENEDELEPSESADLTMHCALLMAEERSGAGPSARAHGTRWMRPHASQQRTFRKFA